MQYLIKERAPGIVNNKTVWEVIATDQDGAYQGRVCWFNTEQQARDYIPVQEGIEVRFERDTLNQHDFKVLINGEHRATFRSNKRFRQAGYELIGGDGTPIAHCIRHVGVGGPLTQADFELATRVAIAAGEAPTLAQIERAQLIEQAWADNRAWDEARSARLARQRREILEAALGLYIQQGDRIHGPEHTTRAMTMLAGLKNGSGWL